MSFCKGQVSADLKKKYDITLNQSSYGQKAGKVTDKKSELDLGEITDVSVEAAKIQSERADGKIVLAPQPDRFTATVTIKTRGKESDNSYITADSNELSVGRTTDIYTKYVHTTGKIMSVEKINK